MVGLVGWLAEEISLYKINVDYDVCIACEACPSTVMNAILKQKQKTIPDCFACGNCLDVCPMNAVHFQRGKRNTPPTGKFDK
ncbi:hypothetical protein GF339_10735 [candidate division KSB3 bacterium]|uniref:4Fe-4S ferredoxin-type domain-containing protein n=1 Tax=candidate division KSB3 bacterium TaxID=2044937 RepID=A0A9D5JVJ0_9BACT|nr:hypothetical protein [candidate division KSB3 bacterium]MBD3325052.1 hypothetical protein [candidate division KSB3 bacterium]